MASRGASNACERGASNRRRGGEKGCLRRRCRSRDGFGRRETKCDRKVTGRREEGNKRKQRVAKLPAVDGERGEGLGVKGGHLTKLWLTQADFCSVFYIIFSSLFVTVTVTAMNKLN